MPPASPDVAAATGRRPRRLVFVIEALTVGGAERMLVALANGFAARGAEVHVVLLSRAGSLADELAPAVRRHLLGKRPGVDALLVPRLRRLVARLRPDAVNSHLWVANFWTRVALAGTGMRIVVTEHSRDTWKSRLYRRLDRSLVPCTDVVVAVSSDTADFYRCEVGVPPALLHVINNGIDTARYAAGDGRALRAAWEPTGTRLLLGTVGRLVAAKNHVRLLEAFAVVRARGHDAVLVIVGDGPERARLEHDVVRLELGDAVRLAGERADVPDVLAALDVFVLSSDREGHPLAVLEAQAAGTPVVATRVGGIREALARDGDEVGGLVVEPGAAALADAVCALDADRPRLARMSGFARRHAAAHFDTARMLERYAALFDDAGDEG